VIRSRRHVLAVAAAASVLLATPSGASAAKSVREHVDLKLVKRTGASRFVHSGTASGTFAGSVRSTITIEHSVVLHGTVTIVTSAGSVRMKVDGRARSLSLRTKFDGTAVITGGTGRYAHAKGTGRFTGVVNRSSWHATLDATGSFTS
jgi:beta-xylosidase